MLAVRRKAAQGRVDAECRRRLELVVPHLRRSVLIGNVIDNHKMTASALSGTFMALADGVFLVDPRARIVFSNAAADALLHSGKIIRGCGSFGSGRRRGQSPAAGSDRNHRGRCKRHERQGRCRAVVRFRGQMLAGPCAPLTASTREEAGIPDAATAAVFVRKAELENPSALETIAKLYKLTAMEVRVLQAVVEIGGAPLTAEALGISETTVKTHLRNLSRRRTADVRPTS